jgi:ParB family chromosome partitioning protein
LPTARSSDAARRSILPTQEGPPDPPASGPGDPERVLALPLDSIEPNPSQPRQSFSAESLQALAESIRTAGVMQPIVVRPLAPASDREPVYQLVAGERRWRAARLLGLPDIPALVRQIDDRTSAEWAIIENVQREDLNPMDRAAALRHLVETYAIPQAALAGRLGLDRSTVANILRLHDLDPFTAKLVREGRLSAGHGRALLGCAEATKRATLAAAASRGEWSVRRTEQAVAAIAAQTDPARHAGSRRSSASVHVTALQRQIGESLGTRVTIEQGRAKGSGRLIIEYYSLDQFEGLLRRLGLEDAATGPL